jgi:hypothetical protein
LFISTSSIELILLISHFQFLDFYFLTSRVLIHSKIINYFNDVSYFQFTILFGVEPWIAPPAFNAKFYSNFCLSTSLVVKHLLINDCLRNNHEKPIPSLQPFTLSALPLEIYIHRLFWTTHTFHFVPEIICPFIPRFTSSTIKLMNPSNGNHTL